MCFRLGCTRATLGCILSLFVHFQAKNPVLNEFFKNYQGEYIQVDGYSGYNDVFINSNIERLGCMAHVRRKFKEAHETGYSKAIEPLNIIKKLYIVEREIKENDLTIEEIMDYRRLNSVPLLHLYIP